MLVTKQQLLAAIMASNEDRWNITHIKIDPRATGSTTYATNGHMAVRVRTKDLPSQSDVPEAPRQSGAEPTIDAPIYLHAAPALEASKALPKSPKLPGFQLGRMLVESAQGRVSIGGTDQLTHKITLADQPEGIQYPRVEHLVRENEHREPVAQILLSAKYLKMIAQYAEKFAVAGTPAVKLTFFGHEHPVLFSWEDPRHEVTGLLMPMKIQETRVIPGPPVAEGGPESPPDSTEIILRPVGDTTRPGLDPVVPDTLAGVDEARASAFLLAREMARKVGRGPTQEDGNDPLGVPGQGIPDVQPVDGARISSAPMEPDIQPAQPGEVHDPPVSAIEAVARGKRRKVMAAP